MDAFQADWLVVFIAAVVNKLIGFIWYSNWLFGPAWHHLTSIKAPKWKGRTHLVSFLVSLVIAYFLSFFEGHLGVTDVSDAMFVGFLLWLGFVATTEITPVIWSHKSPKVFAIENGCKLLSFLAMSGIIGS